MAFLLGWWLISLSGGIFIAMMAIEGDFWLTKLHKHPKERRVTLYLYVMNCMNQRVIPSDQPI